MENCLTVTWIKNFLYLPAFLIAIGIPEQASWSIVVLTTLMVVDFATGILTSYEIDGREAITSRKMTMGAIAKALILLVPFVLILTARGIGVDILFFVQGSISMLVLAETYSIMGNVYAFKTGQRTKEIDAVSFVLKKIKDMILSLLSRDEK
jgi:phage-related holin